MKIKSKITVTLGSILIISGVVFNLSLRDILYKKMETTLNESLTQTLNSTTESLKYRLSSNNKEILKDSFINESNYLMKYITLTNDCYIHIRDNDNNVLSNNTNELFSDEISSLNDISQSGSLVMSIKYVNSSVYGLLSYPVYINDLKLGTFTIEKEFKDIYRDNIDTINLITFIQSFLFISIFLITLLIISTIIKPISNLTIAVKNIEEGNFSFKLKAKHNDEVGILSNEFINMRDKIVNQINTINEEKLKVETLEKHRKEFFNNITHELKTPLTAITGYSEMLLDNLVDDEAFKNRALTRIHSESERVHKLVLDLIAVSKGQTEIKEDFSKLDIKLILTEIIDDLSLKADKYSLSITSSIDNGMILAQENKIKQLLINIIDNAIKYSCNGHIIEVIARSNNDTYTIEVKNNSDGIPENIYNSIFDPFVKNTASPDNYSSGLGLYISKEIVEENNGTISISNGKIVTVTITFNLI